jgi:hypothetical protein
MAQSFQPGDVLIFQLDAGYGLLKILAIDDLQSGEKIWHLAAFEDLFLDADTAEAALQNKTAMRFSEKHLALTDRAFAATQTARMGNYGVTETENAIVNQWRQNPNRLTHDRSIRLLLGLR